THKFIKRDGGRQEPMGREQRKLDVVLMFIGANCAKDYKAFESFIDGHRSALLVHPIAGKWTASCAGPAFRINFATATNQIEVPVSFTESEVDATAPVDTPDV